MLTEILEWFNTQLGDNDFFKGGFLLLVLGSIGYWARAIPSMIWQQIKRLTLVTLSFDESTMLFQLFQSWVDSQGLMDKKRDVMLKVNERVDPPEILIVPDRKSYLVKLGGVWCKMTKQKDEVPNKSDDNSISSLIAPERIWLTCLIWKRAKILATLSYILQEFGLEHEKSVPLYTCDYGYWREQCKLPLRLPENIILREGVYEEIVSDFGEFLESKEWYDERQIPYQRGYMFCGPPGTGKTTLAATLASEFKMRLCTLDLSSIDNDRQIKSAFSSIPNKSIILIEDFDSFIQGRKILGKSEMTFSGLLNAINGVMTSPGRLLIGTTNITQDIDPALVRTGRIDRVFKLDYLDDQQARTIIKKFLGVDSDFTVDEVSPADLVGHLQKYRHDLAKALDSGLLVAERLERLEVDHKLKVEEEKILKEKADETSETGQPDPPTGEPSPTNGTSPARG